MHMYLSVPCTFTWAPHVLVLECPAYLYLSVPCNCTCMSHALVLECPIYLYVSVPCTFTWEHHVFVLERPMYLYLNVTCICTWVPQVLVLERPMYLSAPGTCAWVSHVFVFECPMHLYFSVLVYKVIYLIYLLMNSIDSICPNIWVHYKYTDFHKYFRIVTSSGTRKNENWVQQRTYEYRLCIIFQRRMSPLKSLGDERMKHFRNL